MSLMENVICDMSSVLLQLYFYFIYYSTSLRLFYIYIYVYMIETNKKVPGLVYSCIPKWKINL